MFHQPPKYIPESNQLGLVIVVSLDDKEHLSARMAKIVCFELVGPLNVGSLVSSVDKSSPHQLFYCLSEAMYNKIMNDYPNGIFVGNDTRQKIDDLLSSYSSSTTMLLSTDKIAESDGYHGYTRIFAGDGSPAIDETFTEVSINPSLSIRFKLCQARLYSSFCPLSIGMFQSTFHSIKMQHSFLKIIKKIFSSKGLFPSRANCGQGSVSFIGPRKNGSQSLTSASEGPHENGYWYYRTYINAVYWPFLLGLMNYLLNATSIAPYYFYCHMAKFFPINNSICHHV